MNTIQVSKRGSIGNFETPVEEVVESIVAQVKSGEINPLEYAIFIKRAEKVCELVGKNEELKEIFKEEADKHVAGGVKTFKVFGTKITVGSVHTSFDFKPCNHPEWNALDEAERAIKERKKNLEAELKLMINESGQIGSIKTKSVVVETIPKLTDVAMGEICEVNPPHKFQKMGIKIFA